MAIIMKSAIILTILLFCLSCKQDKIELTNIEPDYTIHSFIQENISFKKKIIKEVSHIKSFKISAKSNKLIVINPDSNHLFYLYDLNSLNYLKKAYQKKSENDFFNYRIRHDKRNDIIYSYIFYENVLNSFKINENERNIIEKDSLQLNFRGYDPVFNLYNKTVIDNIKRNKSDYSNLFSVFTNPYSHEEKSFKGTFFNPLSNLTDTVGFFFANEFYLTPAIDSDNFLCIYLKLPLIEIYDKDLNLINRKIGPDGVFFEEKRIKIADKQFRYKTYTGRPTYFSFSNILSNDYILVGLYDNYYDSTFNKILHFDSNLKPYKMYSLNEDIKDFDVDQNQRRIYCINKKQANEILYFEF